MRRAHAGALALAAAIAPTVARAQVVHVEAGVRVGEVPATPGRGVPVRWVHGFFAGYPFHIEDARDLLDERSFVPAFETWCGVLPGIDVGNGSVADSLGRGAPTLMCAPFLDDTQTAEVACQRLPNLPTGRYWRNGGAAMRARGALAVRRAGVYTFAWGHDDGVSFRIGAIPVYEFPDGTGPRVDVATVSFEAPGLYPFTLEWFDGIGGAVLDWYVAEGNRRTQEFSNFTFTLVPASDLYPLDEAECTARCASCGEATPFCDRAEGRCVSCTATRGCGPCTRCVGGRCEAAPDREGCRRDPTPRLDGGAADAVVGVDRALIEGGVDAGPAAVAPAPAGCACRSPRRESPHLRVAMALILVVGCRRRRR
ncbi:MAG: hypothetical protein U0325_13830 [Polyangiales bacterium]